MIETLLVFAEEAVNEPTVVTPFEEALLAGLVFYHVWCGRLVSRFRDGRNVHSSKWYRAFNEVPTLFLFGIVILAIVKPF